MTPAVAEQLCRLRDDLANETPEQDDRPGSMRWSMEVVGAPDKPDDPAPNDIPLSRSFGGSYSWIATIVPARAATPIPPSNVDVDWPANAFQPAHAEYTSTLFDVSVAVFHKRVVDPSPESERMLDAEMLADGEVAIYAPAADIVDKAVDGLLPSQWIMLVGTQPSGKFLMKWYKIQHLDDETTDLALTAGTTPGRLVSLDGPEWPTGTYQNLRAIILPGVISVVTHPMTMESL
jgi:hypothetical protein